MAYWIGVASRDHVEKAKAGGFCQLSHGKAQPVRRLTSGDWIVYYSPRTQMKDGEAIQAFTAIGRVLPAEPYAVDMGDGFVAERRDVKYLPSTDAPIRPLLDDLGFVTDKKRWASPLRFGLLKIPSDDFTTIARAMGAKIVLMEAE